VYLYIYAFVKWCVLFTCARRLCCDGLLCMSCDGVHYAGQGPLKPSASGTKRSLTSAPGKKARG